MKPITLNKTYNWIKYYNYFCDIISTSYYIPNVKQNNFLATLSSSLRFVATESKGQNTLSLQKQTLRNIIEERYKNTASRHILVQRMLNELDEEIKTIEDMNIFIMTCENIMIPLNQAIANIPSDDKKFTLNIAKSYLDIQGEQGLATVISLWDDLGTKGCLAAERVEIVKAFTLLRILLSKDKDVTEEDRDVVLTAFTQEFERRAAQKRKKRAGGSLEDVTDFLLEYYNIKRAEAPAHFQADIEVDNWIKTKDGWLIGISCKRTLRERWKQVSSAEATVLSKFKIKYIYHIVTFDEDLSDDKLALLGGLRHVFYLPDNSRRLKNAKEHVGLKDYV